MSTLNVNLDLVQKYNVAGPRYTTYPPAPQFTDADHLAGGFRKDRGEQPRVARPLALFSHPVLRNALLVLRLHHRHHANHDKGMAYLEYLDREMAQMAPRLNPQRKVGAIAFRRRHADVSAAGRNPPARRNHPSTFHICAGHRSGSGD